MKNLFNKRLRNIALILLVFIGILLAASGTFEGVGAALTMAFAIPASIAGGFTVKSIEEYNKLTDEEKKDYAAKKQKYDLELQKALIEDAESKDKQIKELMESNKAITEKLQRGVSGSKKENSELISIKNLTDAYKKSLEGRIDIKGIRDNKPVVVEVEVAKAAGIFNTTTHVESGVIVPLREEGYTRVPITQSYVLTNLVRTVGVDVEKFDTIEWTEQYAKQGGAAYVAQAGLKPLMDSKRKKNQAKVVKVAGASEFTEEYLEDVENALEDIRYDANIEILTQIEWGLLNGTGIGELNGVKSYAKLLDDVTFEGKFADPTIFHVFLSARALIKKRFPKSMPNAILVSAGDLVSMVGMMDANQNGIVFPWVTYTNGQLRIMNVPVYEHSDLVDNEYVIGDFNYMTLRYRNTMKEKMTDSHGDNFLENIITYVREIRVASYIRENEAANFIKGTISTDLAFITA